MNFSIQRKKLQEALLLEDSCQNYLILDGASEHVSIQDLYALDIPLFPLCAPETSKNLFLLPYIGLFEDREILENFCLERQGLSAFLLVRSRLDLMALRHGMHRIVHAKTGEKENRRMFRFYDPYILEALMTVADPKQVRMIGKHALSIWIDDIPPCHEIRTPGILKGFCFAETGAEGEAENPREIFEIAPGQIEKMERARGDLFVRSLYHFAGEKVSETSLPADSLEEDIRQMVSWAEKNHMTSLETMKTYLLCALHLGWNFAQKNPDLYSTLTSPGLPHDFKQYKLQEIPGQSLEKKF